MNTKVSGHYMVPMHYQNLKPNFSIVIYYISLFPHYILPLYDVSFYINTHVACLFKSHLLHLLVTGPNQIIKSIHIGVPGRINLEGGVVQWPMV